MPLGDGTGPLGLGPRTGRGLGPCGLGLRGGYGRGFGRGLGYGARVAYATPTVQGNTIWDVLEKIEKKLEELEKKINQG